MEPISRFMLGFLINALWQAPLIMLVASLCDRLMRNAPARFRHWLWVISLLLCLLLPLSGLTGFKQLPAPSLSPAEIIGGENERAERSAPGAGANGGWRRNILSMQPAPLTPAPVLMIAVMGCYLMSLLCHLMMFRRAWRRTNEIYDDAYARDIPELMAQAAARCRATFEIGNIHPLGAERAGAADAGNITPSHYSAGEPLRFGVNGNADHGPGARDGAHPAARFRSQSDL